MLKLDDRTKSNGIQEIILQQRIMRSTRSLSQKLAMSQTFCLKHQREPSIYDMDTYELICERCALFEPQHKHHSFIDSDRLCSTASELSQEIVKALEMLRVDVDSQRNVRSHPIQELGLKKKAKDVAFINQAYDARIKEIEVERQLRIIQVESEVAAAINEVEKSISALVGEEYSKLLKQCEAICVSLKSKDYSSVIKTCHEKQVKSRVAQLENDIEWAIIDFSNKLAFINKENTPPLFKQVSKKEDLLVSDLEKDFIPMFSSLKESRVSTQSDWQTQISFCAPKQTQKHSTNQRSVSQYSVSLSHQSKQGNTLKINSKSEVKNLFIRNNIKTIVGSQLTMNNRQAFEAVKKCSFNNFVSKIDLSYNDLTQKFITQLKREKLQSKFIKKIVVKGIKIDMRELKKEGLLVEVSPRGENTITIGDIMVEF